MGCRVLPRHNDFINVWVDWEEDDDGLMRGDEYDDQHGCGDVLALVDSVHGASGLVAEVGGYHESCAFQTKWKK